MKKVLLTLVAATMILCSCNNTKQFKVTLNLDNADGKMVYLNKANGIIEMCVDSVVFKGNTAVLNVDFGDPQTKYIIKYDKYETCVVFPFFSENQNITITGDYDDMVHWTAVGTHSLDEFNAFRQHSIQIEDATMAIVQEMEAICAEGDTIRCQELWSQALAGMDEYNVLMIDYIKNHPDDIMAHYMLDNSKKSFEPEVLKEIVESFTIETEYSKNVKNYVQEQ